MKIKTYSKSSAHHFVFNQTIDNNKQINARAPWATLLTRAEFSAGLGYFVCFYGYGNDCFLCHFCPVVFLQLLYL